jgi:4-carboxymuconolactone decarboxylase
MAGSWLTLPDPAAYDEAQRQAHQRIASGPRAGVRGPLALWLHSPRFAERAQHLGEFLRFDTVFPSRLSELAILIVARHWEAAYVWCVHEEIALREGLATDFVRRLARDRDATPEADDERAVALFCRQLVQSGRPDDVVRADIIHRYGERGCVELTGIAGYYTTGAFVLGCADLPLPGGGESPFRA